MLNDRDDKHDDHEESEYHFSDEDISYEETETESPKSVNAGATQESLGSRLSNSKRMLGSIVGFFVLVFIVYKIVTPNGSSQADINASLVNVNQTNASKAKPLTPVVTQAQAPTEALPQTPDVQVQVQAPAPTQAAAPPVTNPVPAQASALPAAQPAIAPVAPVATAPATNPNPAVVSQSQAMAPPPVMAAPQQAPSGMEQQPVQAAQTQATVSMPAVIPVQSTQPESLPGVVNTQQPVVTSSSPTLTIVQSPSPDTGVDARVDARIASMEASNQKLLAQVQTDYSQKLNDFSTQNKALQDQIQTLNSRVAGIETQLNQLVRALTQQDVPGQTTAPMPTAGGGMGRSFNSSKQLPPIAQEVKTAFSVQAIIPGRAWLRSDNGEAITVAEGDTIKDLGRVTKIDPYDGIVEVNTGNRIVSLSYGSGAES